MLRRANGAIGVALMTLVAVTALAGIIGTPYDPLVLSFEDRLEAPSAEHWLGTDQFGRDTFSRLVTAARTSLAVSFATVLLALSAGTLIGAVSGYLGGWTDRIAMTVIVRPKPVPATQAKRNPGRRPLPASHPGAEGAAPTTGCRRAPRPRR